MATYRRRSRTRSLVIVLVLAAITLIAVDSRSNGHGVLGDVRGKVSDVFTPIQRATHTALAPVGNFLSGAASYGSLRSENQRLRDQLAGLEAQGVTSSYDQRQAQQVLAQNHLSFVGSIRPVITRVIDNGSSNFENTVTIDHGTDEGIALGQPVVAPGGLVGDILQASKHTATVDLVTDPNFVVGLRLDNAVVASAQGFGRSAPMKLTFDQPPDAGFHLAIGQPLLTSGLSTEKFPPGIPTARVHSVTTVRGAPNPDVTVEPTVDLSRLNYLSVLLYSPPS